MIAYLHGSLALKSAERIIIDVHNIGYEVEISSQTYQQLPAEGKDLKLLIYHHFTDNDQRLFGFFTKDEKKLFELLITVKGVGPKLGLTILSGLPAGQIIEAIVQGDKSALTQITGIGKKTAQRMLLELKDKMEAMALDSVSTSGSAVSSSVKEEAVSALQSLGIKKQAAQKAVQTAGADISETDGVEQLVKKALSRINK
ncbi:MAG: Holliday junction branch migration protein RuvA [Balneolaceae bacterium]|nr:Holliday junction branch migration protein RuvA [Balneolaceae bacterium]